jgi:hypothetical protein
MDYNKYYLEQVSNNEPSYSVYRGREFQKGYGIGGYFQKFFRWIVPLIKAKAIPVLTSASKTVGTELLKSGTNIANDLLQGKDVKKSFEENYDSTVETLKNAVEKKLKGEGINKRRKSVKKPKYVILKKNNQKKAKLDIFD